VVAPVEKVIVSAIDEERVPLAAPFLFTPILFQGGTGDNCARRTKACPAVLAGALE
jgi:hypothetical protein